MSIFLFQVYTGLYMKCASPAGYNIGGVTRYIL